MITTYLAGYIESDVQGAVNWRVNILKKLDDFLQCRIMFSDDDYKEYRLWFIDGGEWYCNINSIDNLDDVTDFETNYVDNINRSTTSRSLQGVLNIRPRPVSGILYNNFIYFTTGVSDSLDFGEDNWWSLDVSTPGITKLRMTPSFDYEMDGGIIMFLGEPPIIEVKAKIWLAPDIPYEYGGQVAFIKNKKFCISNERYEIKTSPKYVKYLSDMPPANVCELYVTHGVDDNIKMEFLLNMYKNT